jgi:hypothetical protein
MVSSISSVETSWSWTAASGNYNASYDVWFTSGATGNINSPIAYLMVWLHSPTGAQPRGSLKNSGVTISGVSGTWNVWSDGACISYVATSDINTISFDLNAFIKDAVSNRDGTIKSTYYLHDVFAGFEIWSGGVGLQSNNFSAVVK